MTNITTPLYAQLRAQIISQIPEIKTVQLWNNQFNRSNGTGTQGRDQNPFQYPAAFIECNNFEFRQLGRGVEEFDFDLIIHFGWKSYLNEDLSHLDIVEKLYYTVERFQQGSFSRLFRVSEKWETNSSDVGINTMTFHVYGKDFNRDVFKYGLLGQITGSSFTFDVVNPSGITFEYNTTLYSGSTDNNGFNVYTGNTLYNPC